MMTAFRRFIASLLVASIAGLGVPLPLHAGVVATDAAIAASDRDRVAGVLDRADVRLRLEAYGVSAAEVKARVAALGDEEVAQLARGIDELPAGGQLIGAIVLVFLVLLLTDILGLTKVFPFTKPVR